MKKLLHLILIALCLTASCLFLQACGFFSPAEDENHVHTYSEEYSSDDTYHWFASTCGHKSAVSGKDKHEYDSDNVCYLCKHVFVKDLPLKYELNEDKKSYSLVGFGDVTVHSFAVPSTYNDLPVTKIAAMAFCNCSTLYNITLPDTITEIGDSAFEACDNLKKIEIPDSVTHLGESVFSFCYALASVKLSNRLTEIKKLTFRACYWLDELIIPDSVKKIGSNICYETRLANLDLGHGVEYIDSYAFDGCDLLQEIRIPPNVKVVGTGAFKSCSGAKSIIIETPDDGLRVRSYAFSGCSALENLAILGKGKVIFEGYTVDNCDKISELYYQGTEQDWQNKITIESIWGDAITEVSRCYYSENTPTASGSFWHFADDNKTIVKW